MAAVNKIHSTRNEKDYTLNSQYTKYIIYTQYLV